MDYPVTRPLIGLTGHKGAGKDTVAGILTWLYDYERQAWADALKREVYEAIGKHLPPVEYFYSKPTFVEWTRFIDAHKHDAPDSQYGWIRPLLQMWGTEYRRNLCGADYWTRQLQLGPGVVVTDCRFPNEVEAIKNAGGVMWSVYRPGYTGDNHASESQIDGLSTTYTVLNGGNLDELAGEVIWTYHGMCKHLTVQAISEGLWTGPLATAWLGLHRYRVAGGTGAWLTLSAI